MQLLFETNDKPEAYLDGKGCYPQAPKRCPHKDCHMPVQLKKHGFYERYIITEEFRGTIRIRRYICPVCGKTVSMLPSFCVPRFQYGVDIIIGMTHDAHQNGSNHRTAREWNERFDQISKRLLLYYLARLRNNRILLQFGANEMSPAFIPLGTIAGDKAWTRSFLFEFEMQHINPSQFNADFFRITGKSFMSKAS